MRTLSDVVEGNEEKEMVDIVGGARLWHRRWEWNDHPGKPGVRSSTQCRKGLVGYIDEIASSLYGPATHRGVRIEPTEIWRDRMIVFHTKNR